MWKEGVPEKNGRYFILVEFKDPVMMSESSIVTRRGVPMVSNYTLEKGWMSAIPEMIVTHWMEVPKV